MRREFGLPKSLQEAVESALNQTKWWGRWPELAKAVTELSNHFHLGQDVTPWSEPRLQAAYLAYFLPLNFSRMRAVLRELQPQNAPLTSEVVDVGSGPGTATLAWPDEIAPASFVHWELSPGAHEIHKHLLNHTNSSLSRRHSWVTSPPSLEGKTVVASYALNEFKKWPAELSKATTLIIVEPSTQEAARRLMAYRLDLKKDGFHLWAPCTHQMNCPLLVHSKTDWCHDRVYFSPPPWWEALARHLPMRNDTVTYSYLIASKTPPARAANIGRVIGDTLREKGKVRQAYCRNESREFLSWLTKAGEPQEIPHGSIAYLPEDTELKGNELRPKKPLEVVSSTDKN